MFLACFSGSNRAQRDNLGESGQCYTPADDRSDARRTDRRVKLTAVAGNLTRRESPSLQTVFGGGARHEVPFPVTFATLQGRNELCERAQ